jgi:hypothetical protein
MWTPVVGRENARDQGPTGLGDSLGQPFGCVAIMITDILRHDRGLYLETIEYFGFVLPKSSEFINLLKIVSTIPYNLYRRLVLQTYAARAHAVRNGPWLATDEPCPPGSLPA